MKVKAFLRTMLSLILVTASLSGLSTVAAEPTYRESFPDPAFAFALASSNRTNVDDDAHFTSQTLKLNRLNIQSLEGAQNLRSLQMLDVSDNQITSLAPIANLSQLNSVIANKNPLCEFESLRQLAIANTHVKLMADEVTSHFAVTETLSYPFTFKNPTDVSASAVDSYEITDISDGGQYNEKLHCVIWPTAPAGSGYSFSYNLKLDGDRISVSGDVSVIRTAPAVPPEPPTEPPTVEPPPEPPTVEPPAPEPPPEPPTVEPPPAPPTVEPPPAPPTVEPPVSVPRRAAKSKAPITSSTAPVVIWAGTHEAMGAYGTYGLRAGTQSDEPYVHDSLDNLGIVMRITLERPDLLTSDVLLSGSCTGQYVQAVTTTVAQSFTNKLAVVALDERSGFGQTVRIVARADLSSMDTEKLVLYSFRANGDSKMIRLADQHYTIDAAGYLHFGTKLGGDIIISEGSLERVQ